MSLIIFFIISLRVGLWIWEHRDKFILNSDSLHKQWLFRLAIVFPLISSVYFILWLGAPYPFRFDAHGYSTFLEINKFSLGILALSPILGAFVVSAHRSLQTEKQIKTAEKQLEEAQNKNKADIYFSTKKFIFEQLSNVTTSKGEKISSVAALYLKAYQPNGNFTDKRLLSIYLKINELLHSAKDNYILDKVDFINKMMFISDCKLNKTFPPLNIETYFANLDFCFDRIKNELFIENKTRNLLEDKYMETIENITKLKKSINHNTEKIKNIAINNKIKIELSSFIIDVNHYILDILTTIYQTIATLNSIDNINILMPSLNKYIELIKSQHS